MLKWRCLCALVLRWCWLFCCGVALMLFLVCCAGSALVFRECCFVCTRAALVLVCMIWSCADTALVLCGGGALVL